MSEAALSFLGFGLPPEVPSWGGMLSREGHQYMEMARQAWRSGLDFARRLSSTLSTCLEMPSGICSIRDFVVVRAVTAPQENANEACSPDCSTPFLSSNTLPNRVAKPHPGTWSQGQRALPS